MALQRELKAVVKVRLSIRYGEPLEISELFRAQFSSAPGLTSPQTSPLKATTAPTNLKTINNLSLPCVMLELQSKFYKASD